MCNKIKFSSYVGQAYIYSLIKHTHFFVNKAVPFKLISSYIVPNPGKKLAIMDILDAYFSLNNLG